MIIYILPIYDIVVLNNCDNLSLSNINSTLKLFGYEYEVKSISSSQVSSVYSPTSQEWFTINQHKVVNGFGINGDDILCIVIMSKEYKYKELSILSNNHNININTNNNKDNNNNKRICSRKRGFFAKSHYGSDHSETKKIRRQ